MRKSTVCCPALHEFFVVDTRNDAETDYTLNATGASLPCYQAVGFAATLIPGDKLPSERELTGRLGVSRTVVRKSLQNP
jgi:hypothetical protein